MYYSSTLIEQMENTIINADSVFEGESTYVRTIFKKNKNIFYSLVVVCWNEIDWGVEDQFINAIFCIHLHRTGN